MLQFTVRGDRAENTMASSIHLQPISIGFASRDRAPGIKLIPSVVMKFPIL
jgi:hypothetical protein